MDYWLCVSVCLCVYVFSRERYNVQMLRASLSETSGWSTLSRLIISVHICHVVWEGSEATEPFRKWLLYKCHRRYVIMV